MPEKCQNCESTVSKKFAQVYGDQEDTIHHCIHCLTKELGGRQLLRSGAGAKPDLDDINSRITLGI